MELKKINPEDQTVLISLYALLQERPEHANISHRKMPSWDEHVAFVRSYPYREWYEIRVSDTFVGSIYVTNHSEIGIGILHSYQRQGIAKEAIQTILNGHGEYLANINPKNKASIHMFEKLGFKHIQNTYRRA